jgi:ABC-type arginine transport system ATPase subunit
MAFEPFEQGEQVPAAVHDPLNTHCVLTYTKEQYTQGLAGTVVCDEVGYLRKVAGHVRR